MMRPMIAVMANAENGEEEKKIPMQSHPVAEIVITCFPCDRETLMIMVNDEDDN